MVDTIITSNKGTAETKELYLGKYEVQETKAPEGYLVKYAEISRRTDLCRSGNEDRIYGDVIALMNLQKERSELQRLMRRQIR